LEDSVSAAATDAPVTDLPVDAVPVLRLGQRDGAIVLAALSLWAAADAWQVATGLAFAALLAALDGAVVGYFVGRIAHEWGHFAGARWGGGIAPTRAGDSFASIVTFFTFDMERSDAGAFRAMSVGGNVGHWLVVLGLAAFIPLDTVGRVALLSGAVGFAISASLTELPVIQRAYAGASPGESFRGLTRAKLKRNRWMGAGAGLLLFVLAL
jgi:hypothetical protein